MSQCHERASRSVVSWAVCEARTPEVMQAVVDAAPPARNYYSDAFNTYRESCWWGGHTSMDNKSQTSPVEAVNAGLRHYHARLGRRSRCFSRCHEALGRAVDLFVRCYNARPLRKGKYPRYPAHLTATI
ncbi:MAG TPA: hypothetical protein VEZ40_04260 [Pyrinomonadaceae bacterium]|nr:hypothetical protein [Pyrinomonadaceae bacterium]